jgi:hypothetical protein
VLTFRVGDGQRPRGHALVFFRDADDPDSVWATYLVVVPITMDLGKYLPAAFAPQLAGQLVAGGPAAYPLPPMPERVEQGLAYLERLAELRSDDLLDGGTLRMGEPWQALHPVTELGSQYAEACASYLGSAATLAADAEPTGAATGESALDDVDNLLLQVMPDRDKVGRLARLVGTLRYAVEGNDGGLVDDTVREMEQIGRHLRDTYQVSALIAAGREPGERAGLLAQLYVERCYKLADEDYGALADLDQRISQARER